MYSICVQVKHYYVEYKSFTGQLRLEPVDPPHSIEPYMTPIEALKLADAIYGVVNLSKELASRDAEEGGSREGNS